MSRARESAASRAAADAEARLGAARAVQLALLPEAAPAAPAEAAPGPKGGRPKGAKDKRASRLRDWLGAQGYQDPAHQVARLAGLDERGDVLEAAMRRVERIAAWAGGSMTPGARVELLVVVLKEMRQAADALLPYVHGKITADTSVTQAVTLVVPGVAGDGARVIEGRARAGGASDMAPPPLPGEIEGNQALGGTAGGASDGARRTDGASGWED